MSITLTSANNPIAVSDTLLTTATDTSAVSVPVEATEQEVDTAAVAEDTMAVGETFEVIPDEWIETGFDAIPTREEGNATTSTTTSVESSNVLDSLGHVLTYTKGEPLLFNSGLFLWLFLGVSAIYWALAKHKHKAMRLLFIVGFSLYYYYKNAGGYCLLLPAFTVLNYFAALKLDATKTPWKRKAWLWGDIAVMLGTLVFFKYTNFFGQAFAQLFDYHYEPLEIFLPVGISFIVFQSMNYIIDVYRQQLKPTRSLLDLAFFVSFFPTLLAGPILRARNFLPQLKREVTVSRTMFGRGAFFIMMGLFKKAIISDYISVNFVQRIFDGPSLYSGLENLMGMYGYALQIYCDFSGYSDIAIGVALWLGFHIPPNFLSPYKSESITEFWRRWHISLSFWLRDYLYISLGGNRKGKFRSYVNQMVTMLLGGLWHGASWNFIIWGALHGIGLCVHKIWRQFRGRDKYYHPQGIKRIGCIILTFHFVCLGWLFFASQTVDVPLQLLKQIFTRMTLTPSFLAEFISGYWIVLLLMLTGYVLHYCPERWTTRLISRFTLLPLPVKAIMMVILVWIVLQVKGSDVMPYIYFDF